MADKDIVKRNNPVGRLWHILNDAKHQSGVRARVAWARALGVPEDDRADLMRQMGLLVELVRSAEEAISRSEPSGEIYAPHFDSIYKSFFQNPEAGWSDAAQYLGDGPMTALQIASERLSHTCPDAELKEDDLGKLEEELNTLIDDVVTSGLEDELKTLLVDQLRAISDAITHYRIAGIEGMRRAVQASIGAIVLRQDLYEKTKGNTVVSKVGCFIGNLITLLNLAKDLSKLLPMAVPFLLTGAGEAPV